MGSGKSYYADKIASFMGVPYIDLDAAIEQDQGRSITDIFAQQGEAEFRSIEARTLRDKVAFLSAQATASSSLVQQGNFTGLIACGGGTPCFHENMKWMNEHGLTVWINPPVDVLKRRLITEKANRPLIAGLDDEAFDEFIETQLQKRDRYYAQAAIQVNDPGMPIEEIIKKIQHA
ncbi:MAG: shikimate kinase [bacterium]